MVRIYLGRGSGRGAGTSSGNLADQILPMGKPDDHDQAADQRDLQPS